MARRLIGTLIIFVLFGVFFSLGLWQLDRADQKRELAAHIAGSAAGELIRIDGAITAPQSLLLRRVQVTGEFVEPVILLDSKKYQEQLGYQVVMPLALENSDQHLLINLGWQAGEADEAVDRFSPPPGRHTLTGQIGTAEKGFRPGFNRPGAETGGVWIYLDPEYLAVHQGYAVLPLVLRLETDLNDGLIRDWPEIEPDPAMHIGYAIQWFSFAGVLVIYFGWRVRVYVKKEHD